MCSYQERESHHFIATGHKRLWLLCVCGEPFVSKFNFADCSFKMVNLHIREDATVHSRLFSHIQHWWFTISRYSRLSTFFCLWYKVTSSFKSKAIRGRSTIFVEMQDGIRFVQDSELLFENRLFVWDQIFYSRLASSILDQHLFFQYWNLIRDWEFLFEIEIIFGIGLIWD